MRTMVLLALGLVLPLSAQTITNTIPQGTGTGLILPLTILFPPSTGADITAACALGNVWLAPGTYNTSASVTCPSNRDLGGSGKGSSTILWTNATDCVLKRDGVSNVVVHDLALSATGSSATMAAACDFNAAGVNQQNTLREVRLIGNQSPPVAGTVGHLIKSTTTNTLYYGVDDHVSALNWDKCWSLLGDETTSAGANAWRFFSPEGNACATHFDLEDYAAANFIYGLHCNGSGQTYQQICAVLGVGAGTSTKTQGNVLDLYADMGTASVGTNRSFVFNGTGVQKNRLHSFTSVSAGTIPNGSLNLNEITEMNVNATRSSFTFGNIALTADNSTPTIQFSPNGTNNGSTMLTANAAGIAGTVMHFRALNGITSNAGNCLTDWQNNVTKVNCIDGDGGMQFGGVTQATLGAPGNSKIQFCTDCTSPSSPCTGGGTGALAVRENGAWKCL